MRKQRNEVVAIFAVTFAVIYAYFAASKKREAKLANKFEKENEE